jgi:hypothetical protein
MNVNAGSTAILITIRALSPADRAISGVSITAPRVTQSSVLLLVTRTTENFSCSSYVRASPFPADWANSMVALSAFAIAEGTSSF